MDDTRELRIGVKSLLAEARIVRQLPSAVTRAVFRRSETPAAGSDFVIQRRQFGE